MKWRVISIDTLNEASDWRMKTQRRSRMLHLRSEQRKRSMANRDMEILIGTIGEEPDGIAIEAKGLKNFR